MNFKIFCALTLVSGFLYFPKTNAAELQDANAQAELAAGTESVPMYMVRKSAEWLITSSTLRMPQKSRPADQTYTRDQLFKKMISVLQEKRPSPAVTQTVVYGWMNTAPDLCLIYAKELRELIQGADFSSEAREGLLTAISSLSTKSGAQVDLASKDKAIRANINAASLIREVRKTFELIPELFKFRNQLIGAVDTISDMLLAGVNPDDCYNDNPDCQFGSNQGLIKFFSKRVNQDHELALSLFRFSLRVSELNQNLNLNQAPSFDQKFTYDLWKDAVAASGGDATRALEVVSVFGHDVCCNGLLDENPGFSFLTQTLSAVSPSGYGSDYNPRSVMYLPGVMNGVNVSKKRVAALKRAQKNYQKAYGGDLPFFRAGYHHVYGGIAIAQEMLARKVAQVGTLSLSTLLSEALGYFYKRQQMDRYLTEDAKVLWAISKNDEAYVFLSKPKSLNEWSKDRFRKAKAELEYHIQAVLYTEEQHRVGAKFALKQFL